MKTIVVKLSAQCTSELTLEVPDDANEDEIENAFSKALEDIPPSLLHWDTDFIDDYEFVED